MVYPPNPQKTFNPAVSSVMHIDFNSCFATIEQQANPLLRGKPVLIAAYATPKGCVLAASREAKAITKIPIGTHVSEIKKLIPQAIVLEPDPGKYRTMHQRLKKLLLQYSPQVEPKSIDEFVIHFNSFHPVPNLQLIAQEIKARIAIEIGEWLTVSIGLGPNRFLAKQAAIFKKPDGLEEINSQTFFHYYSQLKLTDLNGIASANQRRLNLQGISTVMDLYQADIYTLKKAFGGICGYYWYLRLRGYEIDDVPHARRLFGAMYSLPRPALNYSQAQGILLKLVEKAGIRMQRSGYSARGFCLYLRLKNSPSWHVVHTYQQPFFDYLSLFEQTKRFLSQYNFSQPITKMSFSLFNLQAIQHLQCNLFEPTLKKYDLSKTISQVKDKYGSYGLIFANMLGSKSDYKDAIGFGSVKDMEQLVVD